MEVLTQEDMQKAYELLNEQIVQNPGNVTIDVNPDRVLTLPYFIQGLRMDLDSPLNQVDVFFQKVGTIYSASAYVSALIKGMFFDCSKDYMRALAQKSLRFKPLNHHAVGNIFENKESEPIFTIQAAENDCMRTIVPCYKTPNAKPITDQKGFHTLVEKLNIVTSELIAVTLEKRKDTPKLRKVDGIFVYYPESSTLVNSRGKHYHN